MTQFFQQDDLPPGWFLPGDVDVYRYIYNTLVPLLGVTAEIGVYRGRSLMSVADILISKDIHVHCIDTFEPYEDDQDSYRHGAFLITADAYDVRERLNIMKGTSLERSRDIGDSSLDFVFIDADHSYESVKLDIDVWLPKVRIGGWIGGHDYPEFGVKDAVNERVKAYQPAYSVSSIWLAKVTKDLCGLVS